MEVYYGRTETASEPIAVRFYLRIDDKFPVLNASNLDERLTWEWERLTKLAKVLKDTK